MKRFFRILHYYALIPFIASLLGFILALFVSSEIAFFAVPVFTAAIYLLFRKRIDMPFAAKVNGIAAILLLTCFTIMMLMASGNVEGEFMQNFCWLIIPFTPVLLLNMFMGEYMLLYAAVLLTYAAVFVVCAYFSKIKWKKTSVPFVLAVLCVLISGYLYSNRPSVKYAGHGFAYMHGYSSTDFSDYMVYSDPSKLVQLASEASLVIEKEEDMPVLDGAEACYPLYAAFAKAVYQDIDAIEKAWAEEKENRYSNGKIVAFHNSVSGFNRLLLGRNKSDKVDMFFGARPSVRQMREAENVGVELEITPIGREAFVFFVEEDNPVSDLTVEQLRAIYHGDITDWREIGGKNQKILAFQRPENSGSQTMMEYFMGDISLKKPQTYETIGPMAGVIEEVAQYANEKGAIGYSFRYFLEELNQETGVKMLSIDGVYPSLENIENGSYPLVTDVCLITRKDESNPNVQKMIDFILSDTGQEIVRKTGYAGVAK